MPQQLVRLSDTRWKYGKHYIRQTKMRIDDPQPPFTMQSAAVFRIDDEYTVEGQDVQVAVDSINGGGQPAVSASITAAPMCTCGATQGQTHDATCPVAVSGRCSYCRAASGQRHGPNCMIAGMVP